MTCGLPIYTGDTFRVKTGECQGEVIWLGEPSDPDSKLECQTCRATWRDGREPL